MEEYGKVIFLQNILFLGGNKAQMDSKIFTNRPCVVIGETEEEIFVLPFSSTPVRAGEFKFSLYEDDLVLFNKRLMRPITYVKIENIFKKDMCYYEECGYIKEDNYIKLLKVIKNRIDILKKNPVNGEIYQEYEMILYRQLNELYHRKSLRDKTHKVLKRSKNET